MKNYEFHRSLHGRGLTQGSLAKLAGTSRSHLSEVLNNKPGHGGQTRRRLFPHLTLTEAMWLGWLSEYLQWEASSTGNIVPTI